jgi:hypothetical protein
MQQSIGMSGEIDSWWKHPPPLLAALVTALENNAAHSTMGA